jgi:hypothetical protein
VLRAKRPGFALVVVAMLALRTHRVQKSGARRSRWTPHGGSPHRRTLARPEQREAAAGGEGLPQAPLRLAGIRLRRRIIGPLVAIATAARVEEARGSET